MAFNEVVFRSQSYTTGQTSPTMGDTTPLHRGLYINLDITAVVATPSITVQMVAVFASGVECVLIQSVAQTEVSNTTILFCERAGDAYSEAMPGILSGSIIGGPIPVAWKIKTTHGDSDAATYSVSILSALERG